MLTTQREVRKLFKQMHPKLNFKKITDYSGHGKMYVTDTRCAFSDWLDCMTRDGEIGQDLAQRVTL